MSQEEEESKTKKRSPSLHLIIFSDSSRTLNVELIDWHLWVLAAVVSLLLVLSAGSVYFIFSHASFYDTTLAKAKELKSAITQYQIKYEGLYERAYEGQRTERPNVATNVKRTPVRPEVAKKVAPIKAAAPDKEEVVVKLAAKKIPPERDYQVEHEVEILEEREFDLNLRLKVTNADRSEKRLGYMAVVSAFRHADGSYLYTAWPDQVEVDQHTGKILDISKADHYEIRSFKTETINFPKPLTAKGKFEKVIITLSEQGKKKREFVVKVK